jgi:hypothetical protein
LPLKLQIGITKNPFPAVEWIAILNQIEAKQSKETSYPVGSLLKKSFIPVKFHRANFIENTYKWWR